MPRIPTAVRSFLALSLILVALPTAAADPCEAGPYFQTMPCAWQTTRATQADAADATLGADARWQDANATLAAQADAAPHRRAGELVHIGREALNATLPNATAHMRTSSALLVELAYAEYMWAHQPADAALDAVVAGSDWAWDVTMDAHRSACDETHAHYVCDPL